MQSLEMLSDKGAIATKLPGFELRPQQMQMAEMVAFAFQQQEHLIVEAGTGIGKSFAYLVPAIEHVIQSGSRVVISTHTIALQEQLFQKDIPFLQSVVSDEFSAVLVKGRANYLGLRRLARSSTRKKNLFSTKGHVDELHRIEDWAYSTADGSLSDLTPQPDDVVWDLVRSDADDCLGRKCPHYKSCFYQRARRRANTAQLLIVNHALLFSDLAVRERGASILPDYDYLILDEAHTVERVAAEHMGFGTSSTQVGYLLTRLYNERTKRGVLAHGPGEDVIPAVAEVKHVAAGYFSSLVSWLGDQPKGNGRVRTPIPMHQPVGDALGDLKDRLAGARAKIENNEDRLEFSAMMERCRELSETLTAWHQQSQEDWVYWLATRDTPRSRVSLCARPVDIGPVLQERLFSKVKSAVLTSATLSTASSEPFAYTVGRLGFDEVRTSLLGSPFDFQRQLKVIIEKDLPDPSDGPAFVEAVCAAIERNVLRTSGHAFVLFTSYAMLNECADRLGPFLEEQQMPLLVQGSGIPRSLMLQRFRDRPRSVLFGTDTFWTGVDVPGDALANVMIVKLPFAAPNDPMIEARIEQIRKRGGNPFMDFQLPEAVLKFRQGIGRLIRTRRDRGIVVILDPRITRKPYGRFFLDALPPCEVEYV